MVRKLTTLVAAFVFVSLLAHGQDEPKKDDAKEEKKEDKAFVSGPQPGAVLPGSFDVYNINGSHKGKYHCLVCEYGHDPAVMIFVREPEMEKEGAIPLLLQKVEAAVEDHKESYLRGFVVYLSPAARSSATEKTVEEPDKLVKEAMERDALQARLDAQAENYKNIVLSYHPMEGPKGYAIHPKAEVTVVFYKKLKTLNNFAFETGKMTEANVKTIMDTVEKTLRDAKKKTFPAKKNPGSGES